VEKFELDRLVVGDAATTRVENGSSLPTDDVNQRWMAVFRFFCALF
jgi:hypothetical protein